MAQSIENGGGERRGPFDILWHPERRWNITSVDNAVGIREVERFAKWAQNPETARHLVPPLRTIRDYEEYYLTTNGKLFLIARNYYREPKAVVTVMGKNPFLRGYNKRAAYLEKLVVDPEDQHKGIGYSLLTTAHNFIFQPREEDGKPRFEEAHLYIMTDREAGLWQNNYEFFVNKAGYQIDRTKPQWRRYAKEVLGLPDQRDALLLVLTAGGWEEAKKKNPKLQVVPLELPRKVSL